MTGSSSSPIPALRLARRTATIRTGSASREVAASSRVGTPWPTSGLRGCRRLTAGHRLRVVLIVLWALGGARAAFADCTGWEGFRPPVRYSSSGNQVVLVRDLDGDGAPEIITSG